MKGKVSEAMPTLVALAALPGRQVNFRIEKKTKILKEFLQNRREQNRKKVLCKRFSTSCAACELLQRQPPTMNRKKPSTLSLSLSRLSRGVVATRTTR